MDLISLPCIAQSVMRHKKSVPLKNMIRRNGRKRRKEDVDGTNENIPFGELAVDVRYMDIWGVF